METLKLYMILLGCKPAGRFTEQHDVFFGIGESLADLKPQMNLFWPEAKGNLHIDAWREVTFVNGYAVDVMLKSAENLHNDANLFFINLGGYKQNEFEEYHYKMLVAAESLAAATRESKRSAFYKHCGFKGAGSHIDDKYGLDVDDAYKVEDILAVDLKAKYQIKLTKSDARSEDEMHLGYLMLNKLR